MANPVKQPKVWTEGGKGRKLCPSCKKYVPAVSKKCTNPSCGKAIPSQNKGKSSKKSSKNSLEEYIKTVKDAGGLAKLKKAIADYDNVVQPIDKLGGIDKAREILATLEEIKSL